MNLILLGIIKIVDNLIMTAKSIAVYKNRKILSAILMIISQFLFYIVIQQVTTDDSIIPIIVISITSGIGTFLAIEINDRFKKDTMWRNVLTCSDKEYIEGLVSFLIENKIKYIVYDSYNRRWEKTYSVEIFSKTKYQSKLIDGYLEQNETKYLREIIKG